MHEPEPGTGEADCFEVLSSLIESYEAKAWPIEALDAADAVMTVMADRNISREKLALAFGLKSRLSDVLNRKRGLAMAVANRLHDDLQIPASILIQPNVVVSHASLGSKRERVRAGGAGA